ncbi:ricin B-like lectin R40G3 [Magnolia sinica]|uniref:ricin B-like lectin R40G3 n=1 Tax=Magnolia sinica TaxID=86752 RepID=UPI002659994D|nr:ricin B-like lectin R40G3 [Magnolia sinica]
MEYPFGHPKHHHHHHTPERRREEEEEYPPPHHHHPNIPPPERPYTETPEYHRPPEFQRPYTENPEYNRPPDFPRPYTETPEYHRQPDFQRRPQSEYNTPHFPQESQNYPPPPVQHVAHEVRPEFGRESSEHHHRHNPFSFIHHHGHEGGSEGPKKRTVRVYCKAEQNYSLTIRDGKVILARADPNDEFQHWIKDEKFSTKVKDEESFPSFALVNKVTGQAIKHSTGATHPVRLWPHNPDILDESVLWTESKDTGDGFRALRMVNNIRLNLDAYNGDKDHGGVHDGTIAVLWEWKKGDNQKWKIVPY